MKFKVGQTVMLIDNSSKAAPIGSTAVVMGVDDWVKGHIKVVWEGYVNCQMDGYYRSSCFKLILTKNQQLEFSFMSEAT